MHVAARAARLGCSVTAKQLLPSYSCSLQYVMGLCGAKVASSGPVSGAGGSAAESQQQPPAAERKLDPKDFMIIGQEDTLFVKKPGSIAGQQFVIEDCKGCDIYLLDHSAAITVDDCRDCRLFIGPCESSVFLRNCENIQAVIACQQLRTRDCKDMSLLLHCSAGQPVIEASKGIRFGCFDYNYFSLRSQFEAAALCPFDNNWWNVHDFHKSEGVNFELLPPDIRASSLLKPPSDPEVGVEADAAGYVVPRTWGGRPLPFEGECRLVVVLGSRLDAAYDILDAVAPSSSSCLLIRTRRTIPAQTPPLEASLRRANAPSQTLAALKTGPAILLAFHVSAEGSSALAAAVDALNATGQPAAAFLYTQHELAATAAEELFVEIKV